MKKVNFILSIVLLCLYVVSAPASAQSERPNIIFFFVDDLGYGDIGCFWQDNGSTASKKFDTPAIDKMASEGVMLTHHYISASVCAPSRASLISGRHQGHCEIRNNQFDKALPENHTLGSVLKEAGYYTAWIGKGGLAGKEDSVNLSGTGSQNLESNPLKQGFDRFFGYHFHGDGHEHYPQNGTTNKSAYIYDDYQQVTNASLDLYTTDAWTAAAKKVIIDESTDGDTQPFFIYLAYDTPHQKMQRPAVAYPLLDNDGDPTTGGIQWTTAIDTSGHVRYASTATATGTGTMDGYTHPDIPSDWLDSEKQHVGMIRRIDNSIADIIQTLKDIGIDDNTICVFSSDNGPHNAGNNPRTFQSFANMEGIKRDMWEGGIRSPAVIRWPNGIVGTGDENNIRKISYPMAIWDWMPTFADLADVPAPAWCDGVSLVPTLTGTGTQRDKGYLYFEYSISGTTPDWAEFPNHRGDPKGQMQCIRVGNYMGIRTSISTGSENFQIYDVTTDPGQGSNLAAAMPDLQQQMKKQVLRVRRPNASASRPYDGLNLPSLALDHKSYGMRWKSYVGPFPWVTEFRDLTCEANGTATDFDAASHAPESDSGLLYEGYIYVPAAGSYTFYLTNNSGGHLFIHDAHVIDDDFNHDGSEVSGSVNLAAGYHPYRLYYKHGVGDHVLSVKWSGPDITKQAISQANLFIDSPLKGDLNLDDRVNIDDLYEMAAEWISLYDLFNYSDIAQNWLFRYYPEFISNPIVEVSAKVDTAYSSSLADDLNYYYDQMPTLSKVSGPDWLSVAANGALSGTPGLADLGLNTFVVQADEEGTSVEADLEISVVLPPDPADIVSVDLSRTAGDAFTGGQMIGPLQTDSTYWNVTGSPTTGDTANGTLDNLIGNTGQSTGINLAWSSSGSYGYTAAIQDDEHLMAQGYLDDATEGVIVTLTNIPFASYKVYGLLSSAKTTPQFQNFDVNGTWVYGGDATTTLLGWGKIDDNNTAHGEYWTEISSTVQGNYWVIETSGSTCTITGLPKAAATIRGQFTGVIIEDVSVP